MRMLCVNVYRGVGANRVTGLSSTAVLHEGHGGHNGKGRFPDTESLLVPTKLRTYSSTHSRTTALSPQVLSWTCDLRLLLGEFKELNAG
eukprot:1196242-Prorocentrum_minimum.AAC.1